MFVVAYGPKMWPHEICFKTSFYLNQLIFYSMFWEPWKDLNTKHACKTQYFFTV